MIATAPLHPRSKPRKGLRLVALFEAGKGLLVLLVGFGLLRVVHEDLEQVAEDIVRSFHLNPANRYPHIFIELAGRYGNVKLWLLAAMALAYSALRLVEAYGLWGGRRWAEWLAAASGAIYIPLEVYELAHRPSWIKVGTLTMNVAIVAYMAWVLWRARENGEAQRH